MKIVTFRRNDESWPEVGIVRDDNVIALGAHCPTPTALIENWTMAKVPILEYLDKAPAEAILPFATTKLTAPIPRPPKLIVFVVILAFMGTMAYFGRLPRTAPIVPGQLAVSD